MNIVIDARMIKWTGIGRYTWNLLDQLQEIDHANNYTVLLLAKDFDSWQPKSANFTKLVSNYQPYSFGEQLLLPYQLYRLKPDLVHFPHFTAPPLYLRRRVITIHDLTLVYFKTVRGEGLKKVVFEFKYWLMRLVLWTTKLRSHILTDCEFVRQQLLERYSGGLFKLKPGRVTTTLLSVDPQMAEPERPEAIASDLKFLLHVGNYYPSKNIPRLLAAFKLVLPKYPALKLVLAGKADWFQEQVKAEAERLGIAEQVIFPGFISDAELVWVCRHAAAYIFPSLSEGFGLGPLEAMAQGAPVISSSASCLPEICGDAAIYFDPLKPADIADKITGVLQNKELQDRLRAKGYERIKHFSWKRMAEQTLEVYRQTGGKLHDS